MTLVRQRGARIYEAVAQLVLGWILLFAKGLESRNAIEAALGEALRSSREIGQKSLEPHICLLRAELSGDEATRERELREAHRLFAEMGATGHAERIAPLLAESAR